MRIRFVSLLMVVAFMATGGCLDRKLRPLIPCTVSGVVQNVPISRIDKVDLLFVIDNSSSMAQEQMKINVQIPRLVNILIDGDDVANPGTLEPFPPVNSLKVGVVTTNMGLGAAVPGAPTNCGVQGDNGQLQNSGPACTTSDSSAISYQFDNGVSNQAEFVTDVQCVTNQGTQGCGFEKQLDATAAAFTNGGNAGFLRSDALLAVVLVTDEEDCSTDNPEIFDLSDTNSNLKGPYVQLGGVDQTGGDNVQKELRCWKFDSELRAVGDIVDSLKDIKDNPELFVFAAIAGVPNAPVVPSDPDENANLDLTNYDSVLADARMQARPNDESNIAHPFYDTADVNTNSEKLVPVCQNMETTAFPARRIVEAAKGLQDEGISTVVGSICDDDYTNVLNDVISRIGNALRNICLPNPFNRNSEGKVNCEVTEVQPSGGQCDPTRGRTFLRTEEVADGDTREVCLIEQQRSDTAPTAPSEPGWFYDDFTSAINICAAPKQRVSFTNEAAAPLAGTRVRFECLQAVVPNNTDVGTGCGGNAIICDERTAESLREQYDREGLSLFCESASNTCQLSCTTNANCPGGYTCLDMTEDGTPLNAPFCVNPTCTLN